VLWQISSGAGPAGLGWPTLERYGVLLEPVERVEIQNREPLSDPNQNDESVHERAEVMRTPGTRNGITLSTSADIGPPSNRPSYLLLTQVQRIGVDASAAQEEGSTADSQFGRLGEEKRTATREAQPKFHSIYHSGDGAGAGGRDQIITLYFFLSLRGINGITLGSLITYLLTYLEDIHLEFARIEYFDYNHLILTWPHRAVGGTDIGIFCGVLAYAVLLQEF
jgi:hypothetical protein